MNTDTSGIADVWNAVAIDKAMPPWNALTPEEQAEQTDKWQHLCTLCGSPETARLQVLYRAAPDATAKDHPSVRARRIIAVRAYQAGRQMRSRTSLRHDLKRAGLPLSLADGVGLSDDDVALLIEHKDWRSVWLEEEKNKPRKLNDATVYGEVDETLLDRKIFIGSSKAGAQTARGRWQNWPATIYDLLERITEHKEGQKDGACLLQGPVIDGIRQANAIPHLDLLILDLDTGESIDAVRQKLIDEGLFGIIYSTFSHMKPVTDVKRDEVIKWLGGEVEEPDVEQVCNYLQKKKRYQAAILEGAELLPTEHTSAGVMLKVKHQPMPKFRVVMVLQERFEIAKRSLLQRDAITEWKERYAGASKMLGAYFDRSCTDPSRLFYTPRHPKGATNFRIEVVAGNALDLDKVERISAEDLRRESESPFEAAARAMGGGSAEYTTTGLKWFFAKYGDRFEVDEFLMEVDPEGDRGSRSNGPGRTHRCPNDDAHSDAGNLDDKGFFCVNASDGDGAVAHCQHDSCSQLDRINFVDLACQAANIKDATELKKWVPATVEDDEEEEEGETEKEEKKPEAKAYKNVAEAKDAINDLSDDDDDVARGVIGKIAASKFSPTELDSLKKLLVKKTSFGMKTINDEIKRAKPTDEEEIYDDDVRSMLAEWNKKYAVVGMGGKLRILEENDPGELPTIWEQDGFKGMVANVRVAVTDGAGNRKLVPLSRKWIEWEERRTYRGIVFEPGKETPDHFNIWTGFAVKPKSGDWSLLRAHVLDNICQGNEEHFNWFMTWMAQIFQQPGKKLGSAVVIRGRKGTGKSKLFEWLRQALGAHALKVNSSGHITGNFNSHQKGLVLMICEEAFWAGDNQAGNVLKDMITDEEMLMEPKGIDAIRMKNYMRLAFVSNEDWVVPAGLDDERRFFVLEISDAHRGDKSYFGAIDNQMENGGLAAMVHDLMQWQPPGGDWNLLRDPPQTQWLTDQGVASLGIGDMFFVSMIRRGGCFAAYYPDNISPIVLNEDDTTLVPVDELEWFCGQALKGRHEATDHVKFLKRVDQWLVYPRIETLKVHPSRTGVDYDVRCFVVPPLKDIRRTISATSNIQFDSAEDQKATGALQPDVDDFFTGLVRDGGCPAVDGLPLIKLMDEKPEQDDPGNAVRFYEGKNRVQITALRQHAERFVGGGNLDDKLLRTKVVQFLRAEGGKHAVRFGTEKVMACYVTPPLARMRQELGL